VMVYVPLPAERARALRAGERLDALPAHAVTPALCRAVEVGTDDEEADFAALSAAGVAALAGLEGGRRLVLAADVAAGQVEDTGGPSGEVVVSDLTWGRVRSLFADEEAAAPAVLAAARVVQGRPLADAYDEPTVVALTDTWDLLWFAPEELDALG
jgi:hypothetical protein